MERIVGSPRIAGWRLGALTVCAGLLLAACVSPPASRTSPSAPATSSAPTSPKTLRIATLREPVKGLAPPGGTQFGDMTSVAHIFHAGLTVFDPQGNVQPFIAQKVPSLEDGDWVVLPDGRMELTWKLRPDVQWHDGVPLTADDFVFGVQVVQDPEVPLFRGQGIRLLSEVVALDAHTLVARWKEPYFEASVSGPMDIGAVPRRHVGALYDSRDMQAFINNPYWTADWVGLGPFKLSQWELGSHAEAVAFDEFFLGKPKIDRLVIRYFHDLNTMVANLLSGHVDVIPAGTIKIDEVMAIRSAWEPRGSGSILQSQAQIESLRLQFRYPNAPWATDLRVRKALAHMTDRQSLVDALLYGETEVAHVFVSTQDPAYQILERRGFPRYAFDVSIGERLLADAGWIRPDASGRPDLSGRGPDGFVNPAGERFSIELRVVANSTYNVNMGLAIADQWKAARLNPNPFIIPAEIPTKEELKATSNGVYWIPDQLKSRVLENFTTATISSEQSRWRGNNTGAYSNPTYDQMYARFVSTLQPARRHELQADLLGLLAEEVPFIPTLYPSNYATVVRAGIRGPTQLPAEQLVTTWNIHTWELN